MHIFRVYAKVPGFKNGEEFELMGSPREAEPKDFLDQSAPKDAGVRGNYGNRFFQTGGALLHPYANRIRGKLSGKMLSFKIEDKEVSLPANWSGTLSGAEIHCMHGLLLGVPFENWKFSADAHSAKITGIHHLEGRWPSRIDTVGTIHLNAEGMHFNFHSTNTGNEKTWVGMGWHPYFTLPGRNRERVKVVVPPGVKLEINNFDDVFPTGKTTPFETPADGFPLTAIDRDDCYTAFKKPLREIGYDDWAAGISMRMKMPEDRPHPVQAAQLYSPKDALFIALEPQFNLPDPFQGVQAIPNGGMVPLLPQESTEFDVRLTVAELGKRK
jgi:galactose mutarotase-like enzyme